MSEPARASFDATRRTRAERGHRREPALRQGRFCDFRRHKKVTTRRGETRPIPPTEQHATNKKQSHPLDPGLRRGDESLPTAMPAMEARLAAGNGEAEPATLSLLQRRGSLRPAGIVASMSSPPGRVSTRPAGRGWSEGTGASRRCGRGRFFCDFLVATRKSLARRGETRPIIANRKHPKPNGKVKALDPGLRRGDESCPEAAPQAAALHAAGNGEAEPAGLPSAAPSAARGRRELSRRCLSPPGRVSTRPAGRGWSEGTGASRRCGRGRFLVTFSSPQESHSPAGARPGQTANRSTPQTKSKVKALDPACAGRRIVTDRHARDGGTTSRRQWRSRAGRNPPSATPSAARGVAQNARYRISLAWADVLDGAPALFSTGPLK